MFMGTQLGKISDTLSFDKLNLICFNEQGLGDKDVLLKLDIWNAEFRDYKDILQKPEETNKDCVCVLRSPYWRKQILKPLKIWTD